ncbi:H-NS family nucleoid-associated regulatory protein [Rhizobacter sp. Root404]|uniref:H-NS family nucleoid-associated regulatory protein n=1 Tax=Rhizobacter sp. Root404 TaxID=1736528 RepID=UPI00138F3E70|nr:H-NS family nucleoid-associated regulatory protein [Rhizobacter sp. Root404]
MAKTLMEVQRQIADLKAVEDKLRRAEAEGVISRIREAIAVYGLTKKDLFGASGPSAKKASKAKAGGRHNLMYSDGTGNTWSGRGRRPGWLAQALAAGKSLSEFTGASVSDQEADSTSPTSGEKPKRRAGTNAKKTGSAKSVAVKFRSGENAWSGRGSQPKWLKAALAEGKALSDFAV